MLRKETERQQSFHCLLYDKIPEDHLLKKVDRAVDFSFINELLEGSYCKNFGRPAKEPELMMKLLFLQYLYGLSDVRVIEEASYNLVYLWFLGLNPEDSLPDSSLLAKFRTQRMKDITLDEVLCEIVRQCVETGIIKGDALTVDTTHIEANCTKKVPERIMKHLAKRIFKGLQADNGQIPEDVNTDIPDYTQIEDHIRAKQTMKSYLETVMETASPYAGEVTAAAIEEAREVLSDEKQPEFQEKYKKRAAHEWKNAEMKRFHGLVRSRGWGLRSMSIQAKLTAIAVNLKRIAALIDKKSGKNPALGVAISRIGVLLLQFIKLDSNHLRIAT